MAGKFPYVRKETIKRKNPHMIHKSENKQKPTNTNLRYKKITAYPILIKCLQIQFLLNTLLMLQKGKELQY